MILGVSQRKSYVHFVIQFFFFNFIDITFCTKVSTRLNKKAVATGDSFSDTLELPNPPTCSSL